MHPIDGFGGPAAALTLLALAFLGLDHLGRRWRLTRLIRATFADDARRAAFYAAASRRGLD